MLNSEELAMREAAEQGLSTDPATVLSALNRLDIALNVLKKLEWIPDGEGYFCWSCYASSWTEASSDHREHCELHALMKNEAQNGR